MAKANPPHVVWTFRAERRLEQALTRRYVLTGANASLEASMDGLNCILAAALPRATDVLVLDQYLGFNYRDEEHILLAEVRGPLKPGSYVIKCGKAEDLAKELTAWKHCCPVGLRHDLVFMTLEPRYRGGKLVALVYQDAQQFIGMDRTVTLEEAFLGAVLHQSPAPASVANVLDELFARLGHLLYRGAAAVEARGAAIRLNGDRAVDEKLLQLWKEIPSAREAKQMANALAGFEDPVYFLGYLLRMVREDPPAGPHLPRRARGRTHGDLHGRNVLVGLVEGRAHWPALFDYEHMERDNLLCWDFAKLETELKIRAYPLVFTGTSNLAFAERVREFETELAAATEAARTTGQWPAPDGALAAERLRALLLTLRLAAQTYVGPAHNPAEHWLEDYYFTLGCYGVWTVGYPNQQTRERAGALLSAGVAFTRYAFQREARLKR